MSDIEHEAAMHPFISHVVAELHMEDLRSDAARYRAGRFDALRRDRSHGRKSRHVALPLERRRSRPRPVPCTAAPAER